MRSSPQLSRHGVAHANRFPAAGRLMRAGRAGAGGGSDARAHRRLSLSTGARRWQCERDHGCSLSERASVEPIDRRVGTNIRPSRARTPARAGCDEDSHSDARCLANCSPTPRRRRCASFEIFSRKLTCSVAMNEADASVVASPRGLLLITLFILIQ